ncbi:MAG: NitT/TauT family transport system substrate-binding protein, partial [Actinomycetota bacterium]|nr:NitT/TauT family transport system substrate-binding protein [Actinomycetota bacterium]
AQHYYADARLKVTLDPGGPDSPSVQLVSSGSDTFGVAGADQILLAREKGVDVVAVATIYRQTPFVLMTRANANLTTMAQLAGKKVGVKFGQSEEVTYRAMLAAAAMGKPDEVPVKFDLGPFLSGGIDAFPGYSINEALAAGESGVPVNQITAASVGLHMYADTIFTKGSEIRDHPSEVTAFIQATMKGWRWAVDNPDQAAALALGYDRTLKLPHEQAEMKASIASITPDSKPIGFMDTAGWSSLQDILLQQGQMKHRQDIAQVFTTKFLAGP